MVYWILIALFGLWLMTQVAYHKTLRKAKDRLKGQSQVVQTASGPIEFAIKGSGPPVLISHGGAGGFDQCFITAQSHLGDNHQVIAVSRFGHLRTPLAKDSSAPAQADAYAQLLDALDLPKAFIIGTSGGGPSALQFAQRHPDKCMGLILTSAVTSYLPARPLGVYKNDFIYWLITSLFKGLALKKIGVSKDLQGRLTPSETTYIDQLFKSMHPISSRREGLFHDVAEWADQDQWKAHYRLQDIHAPILVIHAVDDTNVPFTHADHIRKNIPHATLLTLPDGGHLKLKHFDQIQREVVAFIHDHQTDEKEVLQ